VPPQQKPIFAADVYLDDRYVGYTDVYGLIKIPNVTAGTHTITAMASGYEKNSVTISVPETLYVVIPLKRIGPPPVAYYAKCEICGYTTPRYPTYSQAGWDIEDHVYGTHGVIPQECVNFHIYEVLA
jgi:hypothetical protein